MFDVLGRVLLRSRAETAPDVKPATAPAVLGLTTVAPAREPIASTNDAKPFVPASDQEIVERQIAALLVAWDKTSLCARREFLTRIDQRIMTTHWIRTARNDAAKGAAAR